MEEGTGLEKTGFEKESNKATGRATDPKELFSEYIDLKVEYSALFFLFSILVMAFKTITANLGNTEVVSAIELARDSIEKRMLSISERFVSVGEEAAAIKDLINATPVTEEKQ